MQTDGLPGDIRAALATGTTPGARRQRSVPPTGDFAQQFAAFHPFARDPSVAITSRGVQPGIEESQRATAPDASARLKRRRQER